MITFRILTKPIQSTALWRGRDGVREMRGNGHAESPRHGRRGVVNWEGASAMRPGGSGHPQRGLAQATLHPVSATHQRLLERLREDFRILLVSQHHRSEEHTSELQSL